MDVPTQRALEEAARWSARLAAPDCTEHERMRFRAWHAQSSLHAQAYAAAQRLSGTLSRLAASDPRLEALANRAYANHTRRPVWKRPVFSLGLAASVVLALIGIRASPDLMHPHTPATEYRTVAGERRSVTLDDGSVVQLDVASELRVRITGKQRQLELISGRALFDVAHDANRPFAVSAGTGHVVALGTEFQVQHRDGRVIVTLAEGSVAVSASTAGQGREVKLRPGEQLSFGTDDASWSKQLVDPQLATSWSRGRHMFRGTPLAEALEEVNRYSAVKARLGDPSLAGLPVGGNFIMGDSEQIVAAFAAVLPLRVVKGSGNEIVLFPRYESHAADSVL